MLKKKILGIPLALFVVGMLLIGGATAALVGYLSNEVTASTTVESPIDLKLAPETGGSWGNNLELGDVYGGDEVVFRLKEVNNANTDIESNLVIWVTETGVVNECDEMDVSFRAEGNTGWTEMDCAEKNNNLKFYYVGTVMPVGHNEVYEVKAALAQNAHGSYSADIQHKDPDY